MEKIKIKALMILPRIFISLYVAIFLAISGCVTAPKLVDHSFQFDVIVDSPGITLLDYRYGTSRLNNTHRSDYEMEKGIVFQRGNVGGEMIVGDFLYMKWKINLSGKILEKTINLKPILPSSIEGKIIYPKIESEDVAIYLISPEKRPSQSPLLGPSKFRFNKVCTLYPTSTCGN